MSFKRLRLVSLNITDWSFAAGGEHYNGRLSWSVQVDRRKPKEYQSKSTCREHRLSYRINRRQAEKLNQKDTAYYSEYRWRVGMRSERFFDKDVLLAEAVKWAESRKSVGLIIESAYGGYHQPYPIVYCRDQGLFDQLKPLSDQMEEWYSETDDPWTTFGEEVVEQCLTEWSSLVQPRFF